MEATLREIRRYITPDGKIPFLEWYYSLRDRKAEIYTFIELLDKLGFRVAILSKEIEV